MATTDGMPWFLMPGEDFLEMLRRAHSGEAPDLLVLEMVANSETERVDPND